MARDPAYDIEVLTSSEALNAARARGDEYAKQLAASREPDSLDSLGTRPLEPTPLYRLAQEPARVMPLLREAASGEGLRAAAACLALAWLREWEFLDRLRELAASAPPAARPEWIAFLGGSSYVLRETPGKEVLAPIVRSWVPPRDDPGRLAAVKAVFEVGGTVDDDGIVEELVEAGARLKNQLWTTNALRLLARRPGPAALAAARALLRSPFLLSRSVRDAAYSRDPRLVPDLEQALSAGVKKGVEGSLLLALAGIQGAAMVPRLRAALIDPELSVSAATGLGIAAAGRGDESLVAELTMAAAGDRDASAYAEAISRIGGPLAVRTLSGLFKRATVRSTMSAAWRVRKVTGAMAIQRFVDAGVIRTMPTAAELSATADVDHAGEPEDVWLFFHFLQRRGAIIETMGQDSEAKTVARHPVLIAACVGATRGRMAIDHVSQDERPGDRPEKFDVIVRFVWGDRVYQLKTTAFGPSFECEAVRALLNEALRDRGYAERFVSLQGNDITQYLFGDQRAVEAACEDLHVTFRSGRDPFAQWRARVQASLRAAASA